MRDKNLGGGIEKDVQKKRSPTDCFGGRARPALSGSFFAGQTFFSSRVKKQSSEPGRVTRSAFSAPPVAVRGQQLVPPRDYTPFIAKCYGAIAYE